MAQAAVAMPQSLLISTDSSALRRLSNKSDMTISWEAKEIPTNFWSATLDGVTFRRWL